MEDILWLFHHKFNTSQMAPEPSSGWHCKSGFGLRKTGGFWGGELGFGVICRGWSGSRAGGGVQ